MSSKGMFSLLKQLVSRMKATIPSRECSKIAAILLAGEISRREQQLYLSAKELEQGKALRDEMAVWESEFGGDGLELV